MGLRPIRYPKIPSTPAIEARWAALKVLTRDNATIEQATAQDGLGICLLALS